MSETTIGSVDAGNPSESNGTDDGGSESVANGFLEALSEDNQKTVETKGWDDPNKIIESYRQLESKLGDSLTLPPDDDQEAIDNFYSRIGRPDKPDAYSFDMPQGLDENFAYDEDSANKFKQWAFKWGLSQRQAQGMHDDFVQDMNGGFVANVTAQQEAGDTAHKQIVEKWGEPKSATYEHNKEMANRAIRELGGSELEDAFKQAGVMRVDGVVTLPAIAFAMAEVGKQLFAEDNVYSAKARSQNPFANDIENVTEQGRILRDDPDLARDLIRAVGREKDFPTTMRQGS